VENVIEICGHVSNGEDILNPSYFDAGCPHCGDRRAYKINLKGDDTYAGFDLTFEADCLACKKPFYIGASIRGESVRVSVTT
jgi:DNA-directed RNA polymerase subunit RPC12/RpoP